VLLAALAGLIGVAGSAAATPAAGPTAAFVCDQHPAPGHETCMAMRRTDLRPRTAAEVRSSATPPGYAPSELQAAYGVPAGLGAGVTVAVVDAYDNPNAEADLAVYRTQFNLPPCTTANGCFRKVDQRGGTAFPAPDPAWAGEISLDLQMVSAACPLCHLLLVEADDSLSRNLYAGVDYAAVHARVVSNSYGHRENAQDSAQSMHFSHPGVTLTAASGDNGYEIDYPAAHPEVIAVGGTSLRRTGDGRGWAEAVWQVSDAQGTSSGCSGQLKPVWQHDPGCAGRTVADVSFDADPATGVAVYDLYASGGWTVYGGTSAGAPFLAGLYALTGGTSARGLYDPANAAALYDVTSGQTAGQCSSYLCRAGVGYDGPTGNGSPRGLSALR
jgi:subtilase family serine protease